MTIMKERIARLRAHQNNIDRYQNLLRTKLSDVEQQYIEKRLSEERFAMAMLHFMTPRRGREVCSPGSAGIG